jgi:hypothetical protein
MSKSKNQNSANAKQSVPTLEFTLVRDASISGKIREKGQKVGLTKEGSEDFLKKHLISKEEYFAKLKEFDKKRK